MKYRVGDWVEVRSKEEILSTLDKKGRLEGLPFMPPMFQYCGRRFRVFKGAHKTCDWVYMSGGRRLPNAVHLELRCDGGAYEGCQTACLIYWKEAWLKPCRESIQSGEGSSCSEPTQYDQMGETAATTEEDVWAGTRVQDQKTTDEPRYVCQATQVLEFTRPLPWWDLRQYWEDYTSGNVSIGRLLRGLVYVVYFNLVQAGLGVGRPLRRLYDRFQALGGGVPFPRRSGTIPVGRPTPASRLDLQPGELVKIKSYKEILATLNTENKNRGLYFDAEEVPFCGGTYRVRNRVDRFIDEKTGKLVSMKNEAIMLDGVWCEARYSECRMFCPRSIYAWWREVWLERDSDNPSSPSEMKEGTVASCGMDHVNSGPRQDKR